MTDQDVFLQRAGFRLRTVTATRYVTPLREGGSLPALMEADDDGLYVVKLRGAAQGAKTLVAELVAGEIGRLLGLHVPELVVVELPAALTLGEPDPEIKGPLDRSVGPNLGLDFLPGALPFNLAMRDPIDPIQAADIVWFDALIANVDRTTRNPNMLRW
ncbi:MAG: aminotransferase class I and II, partial [Chloroflexia bacterium]|nr:aminotransferase class I and II [Chloroflexia bacterium]